jgi:hypothetical protein
METNISRGCVQAFFQLQDILANFLEQLQVKGFGQRKSELVISSSNLLGRF